MRRFILIFLMLLGYLPVTASASKSPANESAQLIAVEHDELTDPQTGARLQGPEVWVPRYDEKLLSGGTLYVSVPECGIDGHARVLSIGECPQVSLSTSGVQAHPSSLVPRNRSRRSDGRKCRSWKNLSRQIHRD